MKDNLYVSASELGEYVFCKRAWWLRVNGYTKENARTVQGTKSHNFLFILLETYGILKILAFTLLGLGLIIGILIICLLLFFNN